jgi:hypothetical protein
VTEADIIHQNGHYWVVKGKGIDHGDDCEGAGVRVPAYVVRYAHPGSAVSIPLSTFRLHEDGKSIGVACCDDWAKRHPVMGYEMYQRFYPRPKLIEEAAASEGNEKEVGA